VANFTYQYGANPPIDYPRMLVSDTQEFQEDGITPAYIFRDSEIMAAAAIASGVWQSSMFFSGQAGSATLPSNPVNYYRTAAILCDSIAANKSRLASIMKTLDVTLQADKGAAAWRALAAEYREVDDNTAAFAIVEQVSTSFSFRPRFWNQVQRQQGIGNF